MKKKKVKTLAVFEDSRVQRRLTLRVSPCGFILEIKRLREGQREQVIFEVEEFFKVVSELDKYRLKTIWDRTKNIRQIFV